MVISGTLQLFFSSLGSSVFQVFHHEHIYFYVNLEGTVGREVYNMKIVSLDFLLSLNMFTPKLLKDEPFFICLRQSLYPNQLLNDLLNRW